MKRINNCFRLLLIASLVLTAMPLLQAQGVKQEKVKTPSGLSGLLEIPETASQPPVVLLIAGSGPTDKDGNNPMLKNNSLKFLAEGLLAEGIAVLRYDKRGVGDNADAQMNEEELRFEDFIGDAQSLAKLLKKDPRFSKVIIAGHSEGSLIGMIVAREQQADAYISMAGPGRRADVVLREQLSNQPPFIKDRAFLILDTLSQSLRADSVPGFLQSLFRPSVQPYLISWFQYEPATELSKLEVPILIVQGTTDLQVKVSDAQALADSNPEAQLKVIEGMNHVFKEAPEDREANIKTYSDPELPIVQELIDVVVGFVKE